jgi:hypothetical protein
MAVAAQRRRVASKLSGLARFFKADGQGLSQILFFDWRQIAWLLKKSIFLKTRKIWGIENV